MVFIEYEINRRRYVEAIRNLQSLLDRKEDLFMRTQPKSVRYDTDRVQNGNLTNAIENYVIQREKLDKDIEEAKAILADRKEFLSVLETDLRRSNEIEDRIYTMRYIDRCRIRRIKRTVNYSEAQIYRILDRIKNEIKENTK